MRRGLLRVPNLDAAALPEDSLLGSASEAGPASGVLYLFVAARDGEAQLARGDHHRVVVLVVDEGDVVTAELQIDGPGGRRLQQPRVERDGAFEWHAIEDDEIVIEETVRNSYYTYMDDISMALFASLEVLA